MLKIIQLFQTVHHLKFSQLGWRLRYKFQRFLENIPLFRILQRTEKKVQGNYINWNVLKTNCDIDSNENQIQQLINDLSSGHLTLLNETLSFDGGSSWYMQGGRKSFRLWRYTLHYHSWLVELAIGCNIGHRHVCEILISKYLSDWIDTCTLGAKGFNHYAWNSYSIATRLDNWRQLIALLPERFWEENIKLSQLFEESYKLQTQYLYDHIEWDLRGNHLLRDALGLLNGSCIIEGSMKNKLREKAVSITLDQLEEQILSGGSHFELSSMYHIEFMRDLIKIYQIVPNAELRYKIVFSIQKMWEYLGWLKHLDGNLVQFNDGSLTNLDLIREPMIESGINPINHNWKGAKYFTCSGVMAYQGNNCTFFMDAGEVGPRYQPGHAHADTLTMELSIYGKRVFIDPGTYGYCFDERRLYDRSTGSHNTIEVDGINSSDVWDVFRVGKRAMPFKRMILEDAKKITFQASHDGYTHLSGKPIHTRMVNWCKDSSNFLILDKVVGSGVHFLKGGWTLEPNWKCTQLESGWRIEHGKTLLSVKISTKETLKLTTRSVVFHPNYGVEFNTMRLEWSISTELPFSINTHIEFQER